MGLDDRPADRQPRAHPVRFGREEGVEDARRTVRIEAGAAILAIDSKLRACALKH